MLLLCTFLTLCLSAVHSQFPRVCTTDEAISDKSCCPAGKDGSPCGSNSGRGICRNWVTHVIIPTLIASGFAASVPQYDDDRLDWPRHYYNKTCECFGNYGGFNCGDCRNGFHGEKCDRNKTVVRREIRELSLTERKKVFRYLKIAKTTKSKDFVVLTTRDRHHRDTYRFVDATIYNVFAWIHYYATQAIMTPSSFDQSHTYAHRGPAFPGWHRLGLVFLERQIQLLTGDEDFALPYYDWRGEKNCSICTNDFMGKNNGQGTLDPFSEFASWRSICSGINYVEAYCPVVEHEYEMERLRRRPGTDNTVNRLPSFQDVVDTLRWSVFDRSPYNSRATRSFRNVLEGFIRPSNGMTPATTMHNQVHVYLGGTMGQVPISANDPMFVLHHCYIDKIFELWITKYNGNPDTYPENDEPGQGPEECCTPYFPCFWNKDLLRKSTDLGYKYSTYQGS
ncbi:tyrosinase-like [Ascaphus truei]|uniref:tyrosinase-like n=1 Tax=Ascaphus truei TaxID=8439 RepID=UPI003F59F660